MSEIYSIMMQDFKRRISKKLRRSKGASKVAMELIAYMKNTYKYDVKVMYDIVEDKIIMVDAYEIKDKFDKEITNVDIFGQELNKEKPVSKNNYRDFLYETKGKAISLAVAGCKTRREIVEKMKEEGFHYNTGDNMFISIAIRVTEDTDKNKILYIYNKVPYIFESAGQSLDDIMSWFEIKRIEQMPLIKTDVICEAYGSDVLQILTKHGISEDKFVKDYYNLREVMECLSKEGDAIKVVNSDKAELMNMWLSNAKKYV